MAITVLVTGSQGFVGRELRYLLESRGACVIGVDAPDSGAEIELDLSDADFSAPALARRVGAVHGIVHLAARITRGSSVDADARRNLRAISEVPVRLLEAFTEAHGAAHLVYCSTIKVYGAQPQPIAASASPLRPEAFSYGSAKALGERLLRVSRRRGSGSYAVVRPSFIYGPGQRSTTAIPRFLQACLAGKPPMVFGDGQQLRDDVAVRDVAYCLAEACLRRVEGIFNAAGERARTLLEVAELCCRAVEAVGGPRGLSPVLDPATRPARWIDQTFDLSSTREQLDYVPLSLIEGLERQAAWVRDGADPKRSPDYSAGSVVGGRS